MPADIGYAKTRLGLNDAFTKYLNTLKEEIGWKRPASADPNVPDIEYLRNDPQVGSRVKQAEQALAEGKSNFFKYAKSSKSVLPETPPAEPRTIYRDMRTKEWTPRGGVMPETPPETPAKVIIPKLPKKLSDSFEKSAISIIKDMDLRGKEAQNVTINMNRMKNYLEKYRNINNLNDAEVDKLFKETSLRADKIVNNDDLFYRQDTLPAQKVFNRVLDNIKTAENSGTRSDKVIAIDGFVNSVHQDFPMSILPRAFDIPNPIEAGEIVGDFLNFASGDFTKTKAYKNIREISK